MPHIVVPRRRIAQPVGPTGVDARALLGSKVILAVPFNGARAFGRAAGPITFGANGSLAGSAVGLALNGGSSAAIASVPLDLSAYNAITVSALVYLRDVSGPDHMIWELTSDGLATTGGFALYAASGGGKFETGHHGDVGMSATGWLTVPANGTWSHIAVVHDFSAPAWVEMRFFLNGVEKSPYVWDAIPENTAASRFANSTLYFLNRAMSSLPTDAMMSAFAILEGNQAAYVPMLAANPWQLFAPERLPVFFPGNTLGAALAGDATASAAATGTLTTAIPLSGAAVLSAQAAGSLSSVIALAGAATAAGGATGNLSTSIALAAAAQAAGASTGALTTAIRLAGDATALAAATGALSSQIALQGAADALGVATGDLTVALGLVGAAQASAQASGALSTSIPLDGSAATATVADGQLTTQIRLAGDAIAAAQASGALTTVIVLSGAAVGAALATGDLTAVSSGLAGDASAGASATGALTTSIPLAGGAQVSVIASGAASTTISLAGAAVGVVSATGDLVVALALSGDAVAAALAGATLTTAITLQGAAVAAAQASGEINIGPVIPVLAEVGVRVSHVVQRAVRTSSTTAVRRGSVHAIRRG